MAEGGNLRLTRRAVLWVIVPALVFLDVMNAIAIVLHNEGRGGRFFSLFSLDGEANVPTWFSSVLLLSVAVMLTIVAADALASAGRWGRHWAGLAVVFAWLSLDETAQIHERVGSWLRAQLDLHGIFHYAGVVPALVVFVVVGFLYVPFLRGLPRETLLGTVLAAAVYVFGAAGVEALTGWWVEHNEDSTTTGVLVVSTFEENLEFIGMTIFLLVALAHFARFGRPVSVSAVR